MQQIRLIAVFWLMRVPIEWNHLIDKDAAQYL
jgi:hypothetical protein